MTPILQYLIEASICLAITVLFYRYVLSELTFFSLNRVLLISMLLLSFIIPAMSFELGYAALGTREFILPEFLVGQGLTETSQLGWQEIVLYSYFAGVLVMTSHLVLGFFILQYHLGKSKLVRFQNYWIALHPKFTPASFFSYILLPDFDPSKAKQQQIILHESIHVQLKHSWDLLLVQFAKIIFWFNPLVYLFERSLREVHEFQADQGVTTTYSRKEYAGLLLQMIACGQGWHFMNNFNQFQTKKRIIMMSRPKSASRQKKRFLLAIPVVAMLFFVFSCEITPEKEIEEPTMMGGKVTPSIGGSDVTARISDVGKDGKEIFDVVEEQPNPPGGMEGWNNYLASALKYPAEARKLGIEGTVIVMFEVNSDGSLSNPEILRGIGAGCDEEVIRVIENSPDWEPGKQSGRTVNTRMRLPVRFKL